MAPLTDARRRMHLGTLHCPGTTDPAAAFTALAALLHRYSGTELTIAARDMDSPLLALRANSKLVHHALEAVLAAPDAHAVPCAPEDADVVITSVPGQLRGLLLALETSTATVPDDVARALLAHGATFVSEALRSPGVPLKDLPDAGAALTDAPAPAPVSDVPVHTLVERHVRERGADTAVRCGYDSLTYTELWNGADRVASRLRAAGAASGDLVGVVADRGIAAVVALLACSMAGVCAVPLDPSYPDERLDLMTDDARLTINIATPELEHRVRGTAPTLLLETLGDMAEAATPVTEPEHLNAELATLMYTSGSTGKPKGVEITHRGICRLVSEEVIGFRPDDVVLQYAPLAFDASLLELWGALTRGARLEIAPPGPLSLSELAEVITVGGVTVAWLTAGLFHQLAEYEPECLKGVRRLLTGGDVVSPHHVREVLTRWPDLEVFNCYGPTENTTFTTCHRVDDPAGAPDPTLPIGRPITGTGVHLLDAYGNPVPAGVPGELWASGDGLARGYAGRADLTAERFVTPEHGPLKGVRMYRTGDMARLREDGALEFLGRRDLQVKVNGFRLELQEIEAAVLAHPGVRQVCATTEPDALGGRRLVAYVVADDDRPDLVRELRIQLRDCLPAFMIPTRWTLIDEFPLTDNGKIDRSRLGTPPSTQKD